MVVRIEMNRLKDLREEKDLNQKDIAAIIKKSREAYKDYETGRLSMNINTLCTLCDYYKVSADYMLCYTDQRKTHPLTNRVKQHRLKDIRLEHNLTQSDISNIINIVQNNYSKYELYKRKVPINVLLILAKYYDTSIDYLLCRTNNPKPYKKSILN